MEQFLEGSFPAPVDGRGGAERCLDCRVVGAGGYGILYLGRHYLCGARRGQRHHPHHKRHDFGDCWRPEFAQDALGTAKVGFNIDPITAPQIPYLAQGAVIPANHEFLAVLGDQTNGTNIEAPLATIQQALAEVMEAYTGPQDITIRFAGDLAQLARVLKPYIDKEENRRGAKLVTGGVY